MCLPVAAGAAAAAAGSGAAATAGGMSLATMASIAGTAISALGVLSNMSAQRQQAKDRNNVNTQELGRQRNYQREADIVNKRTESQFDRGQQDQGVDANASMRNAFLQQGMPQLETTVDSSREGAPATVKSDLGKRIADALSYGRNQATSQAKLGAYGANQFDNTVALGRSAQDLGQVSGFSGQSSDIAGLQLEGANQAGGGARTLADTFRLGGQGSLLYGMTRPGAPPLQKPMVPGQFSLDNPAYG